MMFVCMSSDCEMTLELVMAMNILKEARRKGEVLS
jgi:hypothetical protein